MAKRMCIMLGLVAVAVVCGLVFLWHAASTGEPVYQGRTLSRWLEGHVPSSDAKPAFDSPGWRQVDEALRHIGTNAIPTLLRMIRAQDPPRVMLKLLEVAQRQRLVRFRYRYAEVRHREAEYAFRILGTNAACAVPELIEIYEEAKVSSSQTYAAMALGDIGQGAAAAVPVLLRNFAHTDGRVRFDAVSAIYHIGGDPRVLVPALRRLLKDKKVEVRYNAVAALIRFGRSATAAVPDLLGMLEDQANVGDKSLIEQVEDALWQIAPEKTAKTLVVEGPTPLVANGVTTEPLDVEYNGERVTLIASGRPVPAVAQFWSSEPRGPLTLYRGTSRAHAEDHSLGRFEVVGVLAPPASVNVSVLCVVTDAQIILCARDNHRKLSLEIRRVGGEVTK